MKLAALIADLASSVVASAAARKVLLGRSWQEQPIRAVEVGHRPGTPVLVGGCIHGNETREPRRGCHAPAGQVAQRGLADQVAEATDQTPAREVRLGGSIWSGWKGDGGARRLGPSRRAV
jgi:hypothetical protein